MANSTVPPYTDLLWPTVSAVRALGGSASIDEIVEKVLGQESFTEEQQQVLHGDGPRTEIEYRLAWARTYLKGMGLLINSRRGIWSLTDRGRSVDSPEIGTLHRQYTVQLREVQKRRRVSTADSATDEGQGDGADWRDQLLELLMGLAPGTFERLARRLLREAGFISATVTGRSGDGGIDGLGVYRMSLVSFPVFFNASGTGAASVRLRYATSGVQWPGEATRGC